MTASRLVAQPPAAQKLHVDPHGGADEPQLLGTHPGADLHVPAPDEQRIQGAVRLVQLRRVIALLLDDAPQRSLIPIRLLPLCVHPQVLLNVLLDGYPAVVYVDTRAEDVNSFKYAAILLQNQADQSHGFARF